jgi:hypothetical protein
VTAHRVDWGAPLDVRCVTLEDAAARDPLWGSPWVVVTWVDAGGDVWARVCRVANRAAGARLVAWVDTQAAAHVPACVRCGHPWHGDEDDEPDPCTETAYLHVICDCPGG